MPQLPPDIGEQLLARARELAACSADGARLTRLFLTPEHRAANALVAGWMEDSGMTARVDAIGNLIGRYEGATHGLPALLVGSHLDSVRNAGKYDGMYGVLGGIACVAALARDRQRLPFAIEVIGFADEEGVRFGTGMLGSRALAGTFDPAWLAFRDKDGMAMADALIAYGADPRGIGSAAKRRDDVLGYVELHIEQGPVLERRDLPVGIVTSINGASRAQVTITGQAGHAGTVPMEGRKDALAAAAEGVLAIEARCRAEPGLVGTVGTLAVAPGAINVIPGEVRFSIDIRASDNAQRRRALDDGLAAIAAIAARRGVGVSHRIVHELATAPCAPWLMQQIEHAVVAEGLPAFRLPSGAGHDGMAMITLCDIGMIFVRCAGGLSHHPDESISADDAAAGARVLLRVIAGFTRDGAA